jgi:peptidoglycan/LPS O-acetylase OafA/YrhL
VGIAGSEVSSVGLRPYMPQLDGVRACAVMMVFVSHWIPWSYQGGFPWNNFGVDLFFVLSGFLITDILLRGRRYIEGGEQGLFLTLRQFYIRRALRIFPLYFAFLLCYALTAPSFVDELTPWLWTYTLNLFRVLIDNNWEGPISHLWSLSIEEQFYLVWPWVILLTPRRFLLPVLLLSVAIGPTAKVILGLNEVSERAIRFFTLSRMDTLALGGLLAYVVHQHGLLSVAKSRISDWLIWAGLPLFCVVVGLRAIGIGSTNWLILEMSAETLLCGWVVLRAAQGFQGLIGRFLGSAPLVYLGQISYGLYLLHKPIPSILRAYGIDTDEIPAGIGFLMYTVLAILAASLSWFLFERPINRLKRNFPYRIHGVMPVCEPALAGAARE